MLVYTSDSPRTPGYYWKKCQNKFREYREEIILVTEDHLGPIKPQSFRTDLGYLWAGPINKPETKKD